jgi:hypothetical protein
MLVDVHVAAVAVALGEEKVVHRHLYHLRVP